MRKYNKQEKKNNHRGDLNVFNVNRLQFIIAVNSKPVQTLQNSIQIKIQVHSSYVTKFLSQRKLIKPSFSFYTNNKTSDGVNNR